MLEACSDDYTGEKRLENLWSACLEGNSVIVCQPPRRYFRRTMTIQLAKVFLVLVRISMSVKLSCTRARQ
jgi:hypothetical protein